MHRDLRSELIVHKRDTIACAQAGTFDGTEIDTMGMRSVVFAIELGEAIGVDDCTFQIVECATSGGAFTVIDTDKYLPSGGSRAMVDSPYTYVIATFGCEDTERFIKPRIVATAVADAIDFHVTVIMMPEMREYDTRVIDALP